MTESELLRMDHIGPITIQYIKDGLKAAGLSLASEPLFYPPRQRHIPETDPLSFLNESPHNSHIYLALQRHGINRLEDLSQMTESELRRMDHIGPIIIQYIEDGLKAAGLSLASEPLFYPPRQRHIPETDPLSFLNESPHGSHIYLALKKHGIHKLEDLSQKTESELRRMDDRIGDISIQYIKDGLRAAGLSLASESSPQSLSPRITIVQTDLLNFLNESPRPFQLYDILKEHGINTLEDLSHRTESELLRMDRIGPITIQYIKDGLKAAGLSLAHDPLYPSRQGQIPKEDPLNFLNEFPHSSHIYLALKRHDIHTLEDLSHRTESELLRMDRIGPITIQYIKEGLKAAGLSLARESSPRSLTQNRRITIPQEDPLNFLNESPHGSHIYLALKKHGIHKLEDLSQKTESELRRMDDRIGDTSIQYIKDGLKAAGLSLAHDPLYPSRQGHIPQTDPLYSSRQGQIPQEDPLSFLNESHYSLRIYLALKRHGIHTLEDLSQMTESELRGMDHIGDTSIEYIKGGLIAAGLSLAPSPSPILQQLPITQQPIETLTLANRLVELLKGHDIKTVEDIIQYTEAELRNLIQPIVGYVDLRILSIKSALEKKGLELKHDPSAEIVPISSLGLSDIIYDVLNSRKIQTIKDLTSRTEDQLREIFHESFEKRYYLSEGINSYDAVADVIYYVEFDIAESHYYHSIENHINEIKRALIKRNLSLAEEIHPFDQTIKRAFPSLSTGTLISLSRRGIRSPADLVEKFQRGELNNTFNRQRLGEITSALEESDFLTEPDHCNELFSSARL